MKIKYLLLSVFILSLWGCETDVEDPNASVPEPVYNPTSGDADFSNYVSMGESIAAGVTDGSLFIAGQSNSYPNIMAGYMSMAGGGEFTQPYVDDNVGGLNVNGQPFWGARLYFDGAGPAQVSGSPTTEALDTEPGPYNNMAFPFVNGVHMVAPGYGSIAGLSTGTANPWFVRAASSDGATILGDVAGQMPTFVTLMPGSDFASYALSGADESSVTLDVGGPQGMLFGVGATLQTLGTMVPNGVVTTIPDPTNSAVWNTVTYNSIPLTDEAQILQINTGLGAYNGVMALTQVECLDGVALAGGQFLPAPCGELTSIANPLFGLLSAEEAVARTIATRVVGANPILIEDETLTPIDLTGLGLGVLPSMRDANENDKIGLTAATVLGQPVDPAMPTAVWGVTAPLTDMYTLIPSEVQYIQEELAIANAAVSASVPSGWALFDLGGLYNEVVTTGIFESDFNMTGDLVFGGFFSLDGYHPTSRGSALIAKRMMEAIDATWGSNLSEAGLDLGDYPTNYPAGM